MVLEISPPLEDRLRLAARRLHLDEEGVQRWLLTIIESAVPGKEQLSETNLVATVNSGFPAEWWDRYRQLVTERDAERISAPDLESLIEMSREAETLQAQRLEALEELARLRGVPHTNLMAEMGLAPQPLPES
jgi:hypothetical protein